MIAYTPGPWKAVAGLSQWNVTTATGRTLNICAIYTDRVEQEANARLIAKAPETAAERDLLKAENATLRASNAELLAAMENIAQLVSREKCEQAPPDVLFALLEIKVDIARAAIANAEKLKP